MSKKIKNELNNLKQELQAAKSKLKKVARQESNVNVTKKSRNVSLTKKGGRDVGGDPCMVKAILNPFHPTTEGCRVDDGFPFPTTTARVHGSGSIVMNSGTTGGMIFIPSAAVSFYNDSTLGVTGANSTGTFSDSTGWGNFTSESNFDNIGSMARLVSCGIKFKNNMNFSTVAGRVQVAPVICGRNFIDTATLTAQSAQFSSATFRQIFVGGQVPATTLDMAGSSEYNIDELISKELLLVCRPTGSNANRWKTCHTNVTAGTMQANSGTQFYVTSTQVNNTSNDISEVASCEDWNGFSVYFTGIPTGQSIAYEVVYHYEFVPQVTGGAQLVPTAYPKEVSGYSWDQQLKMLSNRAWTAVTNPGTAGMLARMAIGAGVSYASRQMPLMTAVGRRGALMITNG